MSLEKKADVKANTSTHEEGESSGQSSSDIVNHVAENIVLEGEGECLVDFPSQAEMEEVDCYYELSSQLYPQSQANLEEIDCYFELLSQMFAEHERPSYQDLDPLSNGFNSDYNWVQTQSRTIEPKEDFALLDLNLRNEREAYPVETISPEKLVIESEGLDWDVFGMSSAQPLESISEISSIENGGMSIDANNEVAIAQVIEATEHVPANKHEVELEWKSFFIPRIHHS